MSEWTILDNGHEMNLLETDNIVTSRQVDGVEDEEMQFSGKTVDQVCKVRDRTQDSGVEIELGPVSPNRSS
ncbi:hypothetical protein M8J75_003520 [Diaphorina citri]|nr:hypothetical protein M8J75_003520 [Diaphorina citri]